MDMTGTDVAVGGGIALIGKYLWDRFVSTEGRSYNALVTQQADRMNVQEARLATLENGLDEERRERREAEARVYELTMRIMHLEYMLKEAGIEVPK